MPVSTDRISRNRSFRGAVRTDGWGGKPEMARRWLRWSLSAGLGLVSALPLGCNRAQYRMDADSEVYALIDEKAVLERDGLVRRLEVDPRSRMFDPFNPDRPPMPEDDPAAHRYMEMVDKKKHYPLWDINGHTNAAENPVWWQHLPLDERGVLVLDVDSAVQLALLHSPAYQSEVETLYLSALDVSSERFRFDTQFFAGAAFDTSLEQGGSTVGTRAYSRGRRPFAIQKRYATGSELIVGLANNITWSLAGPDDQSASTLLDFTFIQPFLRQGGRDWWLERLTLAERTLLYNIRAFERYRRGFYLQVAIGRNAEPGPTRRGGLFGGAGLDNFSGLGGGFGRVGATGGGNQGFGGGAAVPRVGGFLGLLQTQLEIRNAEENIARLKDNLLRFEDTLRELQTTIPATQDTIPSQQLQVAQARQALLSSQAALLQNRANFESTLDQFKTLMGIPPYICVEVRDPLLKQFNLIGEPLKDRRNAVANLRDSIGQTNSRILTMSQTGQDKETGDSFRQIEDSPKLREELEEIRQQADQISQVRATILEQDLPELEADLKRLSQTKPQRKSQLEKMKGTYERDKDRICGLLPGGIVDPSLFETSELDSLDDALAKELRRLQSRFEAGRDKIDQLKKNLDRLVAEGGDSDPRKNFAAIRDQAVLQSQDILATMAEDVLALQVLQARARTESVILPEVDLGERDAVEIARANRVDWFNAKAGLVDSWRSIEFVADDLESYLDLVFSGDIRNTTDNPLSLSDSTGRLRAGFQWDSPLTRIQERNSYRQALIDYQQARRSYYQFEDGIWASLRGQLRSIEQNRLNFELQRYAVRIAASQIILNEDIRQVRESLNQASGPTAARDSVSALTDLLSAQNTFQGVWIFYESLRRSLDQDLGTMRLDERGMWIDPGPITLDNFTLEPLVTDPDAIPCLPADLQREAQGIRSPAPLEFSAEG